MDRHGGRNVKDTQRRAPAPSSLEEVNRIGHGYAVDHYDINQLRSKWSLSKGHLQGCVISHTSPPVGYTP